MSNKSVSDNLSGNRRVICDNEEEEPVGIDIQGQIQRIAEEYSNSQTQHTEQRDAEIELCAETQVGGTYAIAKTYEEAQEHLSKLKNSATCGGSDKDATRDLVRTNLFENQGSEIFPDHANGNVRSQGEVPYLLIENKDCSMSVLNCKHKMTDKSIDSRVNHVNFFHPDKVAQLSESAGLNPVPETAILKEIRKSQFNKFEAEALQCEQLNSGEAQHVPLLYAVGASDEYVLLLEEKVAGMELSAVMEGSRSKPLTQNALYHICEATVNSLEALKNAKIAHLDVKPQNAILRSNVETDALDNNSAQSVDLEKPMTLCHIDFGFAVGMSAMEFNNPGESQLCGTPQYMSPQQVKNVKNWYDFCEKRSNAYASPPAMAPLREENHLCESLLNPSSVQRVNSEDGLRHSELDNNHVERSEDRPGNSTLQTRMCSSSVHPVCGDSLDVHNLTAGGAQLRDHSYLPSHLLKKTPKKALRFAGNIVLSSEDIGNAYPCDERSPYKNGRSQNTDEKPDLRIEDWNDYQSAALMLHAVANGSPFFSMPNAVTFRDRVEQRYNLEKLDCSNSELKHSTFISKLSELSSNMPERFPKWFVELLKAMYIGQISCLKRCLRAAQMELKERKTNTTYSQNMLQGSSRDEYEKVSVTSVGITLNSSHQQPECETVDS